MVTGPNGYIPSKDVLTLKERNGDLPRRDTSKEARLKAYRPDQKQFKIWTDGGGAKEDFMRISVLDDNPGIISYNDIVIYESMMKNQSNEIVSDLNTKLLMEYKKEYEAELMARAEAEPKGLIGKKPVKMDPRQPKDSPTPINGSSPHSSTPIQGKTFNLKI